MHAAVGLVEASTPHGTHRSFWDVSHPAEIDVKPTLLNRQDVTRFSLADVEQRRYSPAIHINTIGVALR